MSIATEKTFETAIVQSLIDNGGYMAGNSPDYSPELGMFKYEVIKFLQDSQPENWQKISGIHGSDTENRIIQRIYKEMDLRGSLDVIRNGFIDYGVRFRLAFFKPESGLNPETQVLYNKNKLKIYRQVYFSSQNKNKFALLTNQVAKNF